MRYIIDIDGTILNSPPSEYTLAVPMNDRIAKINKLWQEGNYIIYWTARGAQSGIDWAKYTENQLKAFGCKYDELVMGKPHYDIWIDDKAVNAYIFFNE